MPHHFNCCVPGCTNSFRNSSGLQFYRIPKDKDLRKTYRLILKNETLKLDSELTRVCSSHFEGGMKLSRHHLPSIFPWSKETTQRRELKRLSPEEVATHVPKKRKKDTVITLEEEETLVTNDQLPEEKNKDASTQTDLTAAELYQQENRERELLARLNKLETELLAVNIENRRIEIGNEKLMSEVEGLQSELNKPIKFDIEKYKDSPDDITFYTGFPDYDAFMLCYKIVEDSAKNINYATEKIYVDMEGHRKSGRPRVLTTFQEYTLVMMRLRLGLFERDLSHRFSVSLMTVSRVTRAWIRFLRCEFEPLFKIPSAKEISVHMPPVFKHFYPKLTVIVDCTEIELEKPSSLDAQSACYSSYKSKTTAKALLGITPSGALCFVSEFFPGSISDKEITLQSGFLNKLRPGDQVMADKGFNCQDELATVGATLVTPAFLKGINQFSKQQTEHNKKVASLRIHVERLMERLKNWHIFDHRIPVVLTPIASDILIVVAALTNFHPPLIN